MTWTRNVRHSLQIAGAYHSASECRHSLKEQFNRNLADSDKVFICQIHMHLLLQGPQALWHFECQAPAQLAFSDVLRTGQRHSAIFSQKDIILWAITFVHRAASRRACLQLGV